MNRVKLSNYRISFSQIQIRLFFLERVQLMDLMPKDKLINRLDMVMDNVDGCPTLINLMPR